MMKNIAVLTSKGISLRTVSEDIAKSAIKNNMNATLKIGMDKISELLSRFDKIIIFIPFDPHYVLSWISLYTSLKSYDKDVAFYTTIEGTPDPELMRPWIPSTVSPIANSRATAKHLQSAGLTVSDIVYHGVDVEMFDMVRNSNVKVDKDYVVFGIVAFSHRRKGFDSLEKIIQMALGKLPQARFHIISDDIALERFSKYSNVFVENTFSLLPRIEILQRMANFDFYISTSYAEGFCLPILESQALGKPCIHADYEPLSEISHQDNLKVPVKRTENIRLEEGVIYKFHYYDEKEMFERVIEACDMYLNNKEKYEDLSQKLIEHARKFDIVHMYKPLVV